MHIALIGLGRMGRILGEVARERGHAVHAIDPRAEGAEFREISEASLDGVDLCFEFTHPESAVENIRKAAALGKSVVTGTTGWFPRLEEVKALVEEAGIGFLYGSNFSLGVNIFYALVRRAAEPVPLPRQWWRQRSQ